MLLIPVYCMERWFFPVYFYLKLSYDTLGTSLQSRWHFVDTFYGWQLMGKGFQAIRNAKNNISNE